VEYDPGTTVDVTMHDGSRLRLRKLNEEFDPTNRIEAIRTLLEAHADHEVLTGVFYIEPNKPNFLDLLHLAEKPLTQLEFDELRPPKTALDEVMEDLR
jgi:2-oxoglutarate ferredoxin oxidoreductase subunit beta